MPILRVSEVRSMSAEERKARLIELRSELARAQTMVNAGGAVENPSRIREIRRAIARILTVASEERSLGERGT